MSNLNLLLAALVVSAGSLSAHAAHPFKVTVTNGSPMPISPGVIYVSKPRHETLGVGQKPTPGFVELCQTGSPAARSRELAAQTSVHSSQATAAPILPGQTIELTANLEDFDQALHFEAMYGKTKDTCAVFSIGGQELESLKSGAKILRKDEVLASGAFTDPVSPATENAATCDMAASPIDCLRQLAPVQAEDLKHIRYFPGYLPSVVNFLEQKYGAAGTQELILPTSGSVTFKIQAIH